jgi:uncharacterized protein (TIGR01777 family)
MTSSKKILITGATGLVGTRLTKMLQARGHQVSHLSRSQRKGQVKSFVWNVEKQQLDEKALECDAIVHLAGANVSDKRWTSKRKQEILQSRTDSTRLLCERLKSKKGSVTSFISASAIGYYGFENDEVNSETSPPGKDFLADVVVQWEKEIDRIASLDIRVVKIRIGIVLSPEGGAMKEIMKPVKLFVGAPLGSGDQYMSWIHLDDLCNIFVKAVEDSSLSGPFNAVAPEPVTNRQLTHEIAKVLHRPLILPAVPAFVLKLILGEMSNIVVKGSRVSPKKILQSGFQFKFTQINEAVCDLLKKESG